MPTGHDAEDAFVDRSARPFRPARTEGSPPPQSRSRDPEPPDPSPLLGLQRAAGNAAVVRLLERRSLLSRPGDEFERHASQPHGAQNTAAPTPPRGDEALRTHLDVVLDRLGSGSPLPDAVRVPLQAHFGADLSTVRTHQSAEATVANDTLGADAFTYGNHVYYGSGRAPTLDPLTAHEVGHVLQQRTSTDTADRSPQRRIQPSFTGSFPVTTGVFEVDWQTRQGKAATPTTHIGFDGYMRFLPAIGAPNSNQIVFTQIVKLTDRGGTDVSPGTLGAAQAARGALGQPGLRTADDPTRGVVGGFFTDATHQTGATPAAPGTAVSPDFDFSPAAGGTTGIVGQTQQPAIRGGGTGGNNVLESGFKRSDDLADMHSTAMYDTPGTTDPHANLVFEFESVVRGIDTQLVYGSVRWGFDLVDGVVQNEHFETVDTASATFTEAMNRHEDFYLHEPLTVYFDFNSATVSAAEGAKLDALLPYLTRNPRARMSLEGLADLRGGASNANADLALRRADAVRAELLTRGVTASRFDSATVGTAPSTTATANAGTGDLGGDAALGAQQDREANRWANRRAVVTFTVVPGP